MRHIKNYYLSREQNLQEQMRFVNSQINSQMGFLVEDDSQAGDTNIPSVPVNPNPRSEEHTSELPVTL